MIISMRQRLHDFIYDIRSALSDFVPCYRLGKKMRLAHFSQQTDVFAYSFLMGATHKTIVRQHMSTKAQ